MKIYSSRRKITLDDFVGADTWVLIEVWFAWNPFNYSTAWVKVKEKYNDGISDIYKVNQFLEDEHRIDRDCELNADQVRIKEPMELLSTEEIYELYKEGQS